MVNKLKPYRQLVVLVGLVTIQSETFTLTPNLAYKAIRARQNKIAAMYSCANSPTSLSHYSVNITGINIGNITSLKQLI